MEYFHCYHSYARKTRSLTDEQLGRLFRALMEYSETREVPELDGPEAMAFDFIADDIDRAAASYARKCAKNKENADARYGGRDAETAEDDADGYERMRTDATACDRIRTNTDEYDRIRTNTNVHITKTKTKTKTNTNTSTKENTEGEREGEPKRFAPPSADEVAEYCDEHGIAIDPERFCTYYASNGWKVGRVPMKDWRAAVRNWAARDRATARSGTQSEYRNADLEKFEVDLSKLAEEMSV